MRKFDAAYKLFEASGLDGICELSIRAHKNSTFAAECEKLDKEGWVAHASISVSRTATEASRQAIAGMRAMLAEAGLNPKPKKVARR